MKPLVNLLTVLGMVFGALGAAGFHNPLAEARSGLDDLVGAQQERVVVLYEQMEDLAQSAESVAWPEDFPGLPASFESREERLEAAVAALGEAPSEQQIEAARREVGRVFEQEAAVVEEAAPALLERLDWETREGEDPAARRERLAGETAGGVEARDALNQFDLLAGTLDDHADGAREIAAAEREIATIEEERPEAERETLALPLFLAGIVFMIGAGVAARVGRKAGAEGAGRAAGSGSAEMVELVREVRGRVHDLHARLPGLDGEELRASIESLQTGPLFDLGVRHERWIQVLGFSCYAQVWGGVASAERLLARSWSMATDGHVEEAREEIPRVRAAIDEAWASMQAAELVQD